MERLTEWYDDGEHKGILVKEYPTENSLKTLYQKFGEQNDYSDCKEGYLGMEKLKKYEDAEEQGLLLRLPCKVGDTLWSFIGHKVVEVEVLSVKYECEAENYGVFIRERIIVSGKDIVATEIDFSDIGKTVFLTKEEAEQALKQMESEE